MFKCLLCDKTFNTVVEARNHIIKDHNAKRNIDYFIEYIVPIDMNKLKEEIERNLHCCRGLKCVDITLRHQPIYPILEIEISDCRSEITLDLIECIIKDIVPILKKFGIPENKMIVNGVSDIIQPEDYCPAIVISINTMGVWENETQ